MRNLEFWYAGSKLNGEAGGAISTQFVYLEEHLKDGKKIGNRVKRHSKVKNHEHSPKLKGIQIQRNNVI